MRAPGSTSITTTMQAAAAASTRAAASPRDRAGAWASDAGGDVAAVLELGGTVTGGNEGVRTEL